MKAIVLEFDGTIKDEKSLVLELANVLKKQIPDIGGVGTVTVLNDADVAKALVNKAKTVEGKTEIKITSREEEPDLPKIKLFCKKIIAAIGAPSMQADAEFTSALCRYILSRDRNDIIDTVRIIAKINNKEEFTEHRKILESYGLTRLPEILRDMNYFCKFF